MRKLMCLAACAALAGASPALANDYTSATQVQLEDLFNGYKLNPRWKAVPVAGTTVAVSGEQVQLAGTPTDTSGPYVGPSLQLVKTFPTAKSFTVSIDVRTAAGSDPAGITEGSHFMCWVGGNGGNPAIALTYWDGAYRNSIGDNRYYTEAFGDEMTSWHTWSFSYDAAAKTMKTFVDFRQIGVTMGPGPVGPEPFGMYFDPDLGTAATLTCGVFVRPGTPTDMRLDNFKLRYAP
jgi:hypothetical protein